MTKPKVYTVKKAPVKQKLMEQARREMGAATHPALTIPPMKRNTKYNL